MGAGVFGCKTRKFVGNSLRLTNPVTPSYENHPASVNTDVLRFLRSPRSYGGDVARVETIETHHAWVFLVGGHCYKMKKSRASARKTAYSLDERKRLCEEEYRLNRQLSPDTYIGVVPLVADEGGGLRIGGDGRVVEWLVKMRRLPDECLFHRAVERGAVGTADVTRVVATLVDFYREALRCHPGRTAYMTRLRSEIAETGDALRHPDFGFDTSVIDRCLAGMNDYLATHVTAIEARDRDGLIREVHGDLRPEHVCLLSDRVEIIDRLEFDADLRCLDCVEELAFFCMECRYIAQDWIESVCIDAYESLSGDEVPRSLWRFYAARRACVRAMLCAWHSQDDDRPEHWLSRGRRYLALAEASVAAMAGGASA